MRFSDRLLASVLLALGVFVSLVSAAPIKSLLPDFGFAGEEFSTKGQQGHVVKGWLPTGWNDNSEWAPITGTYSKLEDFPEDANGAVRMRAEKMDEGQMQLTSYAGERTYTKGQPYRFVGWVRSPEKQTISVIVRQAAEPYEAYYESDVTTGTAWKPFELNFQPVKDIKAIVMVALKETGTVDVAGLAVAEGGPPFSLLPVFGTEGADFTNAAAKGNMVRGWLPTGWNDNTEWAAVTATYSRLDDAPPETFGAVRIKVEKVEEGQLQLTSFDAERAYEKGKTYQVTGWIRSPERLSLSVGARQVAEPYELYYEGDVNAGPEWKAFTYSFKPAKDIRAMIMLSVKRPGTVDLAGVAVTEK